MRNPENVLISLTKHSNQKDYKYERLYRLLYNEELYLTAYQNIYSNDGNYYTIVPANSKKFTVTFTPTTL